MNLGIFITSKDVARIQNCSMNSARRMLRKIAEDNNIWRRDKNGNIIPNKHGNPLPNVKRVTTAMYAKEVGVDLETLILRSRKL